MIETKVSFSPDNPALALHLSLETSDDEVCGKCFEGGIFIVGILTAGRKKIQEGHTVEITGLCDEAQRKYGGCGLGLFTTVVVKNEGTH